MKDISKSIHHKNFIKYKDIHGNYTGGYRLSFFADWKYKYKDVCFMRMFSRMDEWELDNKHRFLYFDDLIPYINYDKLRLDIHKNYGKALRCTIYTDEKSVLFSFKEKTSTSYGLACCMYLSLFNVLRCVGNEYEERLKNRIFDSIGKNKIETLYDGVVVFSKVVNQGYGHNLNDGLSKLINILGEESIEALSKYYMEVVSSLFGVSSKVPMETIELIFASKIGNIKKDRYGFPGQTTLFGHLEEVYYEICNS